MKWHAYDEKYFFEINDMYELVDTKSSKNGP